MAEGGNSKGATLGLIIGTLVAIGGGFGFGAILLKKPEPEAVAAPSAKEAKVPESEVRPLAPIVANLGNPPDLFVRLQAAVVLEPNTPESNALITKVGDDVVAYLRTVSISRDPGAHRLSILQGRSEKAGCSAWRREDSRFSSNNLCR